jgi:hypothetical protein
MIKLFGWEAKIDKRISEKREVELIWTWKTKILELVNNNLKCASYWFVWHKITDMYIAM